MYKKKKALVFIDTENCSPRIVDLLSQLRYKWPDYTIEHFYCYSVKDNISSTSLSWKKIANNYDGYAMFELAGKREKNKVDEAIIYDIRRLLNHPNHQDIQKWILISSDGDYLEIIKEVLNKKKEVCVISSGHISSKISKLPIETIEVLY